MSPFENLNRSERRRIASFARHESLKRPLTLSEIPRKQWPASQTDQTHVWVSQKWLVQMFDEAPFQMIDTRRISISRVTLKADGRWEEGERNVSKRPALSAAEKRYREYAAFLRGAEWERRRWLKQQKARDLAYLQPRVYG